MLVFRYRDTSRRAGLLSFASLSFTAITPASVVLNERYSGYVSS